MSNPDDSNSPVDQTGPWEKYKMVKGRSHAGQGQIEYILIIAVVALAIVGFIVAYEDQSEEVTATMENQTQDAIDEVKQGP